MHSQNRIEEVHNLEIQVKSLQAMVSDYKKHAGWIPKIGTQIKGNNVIVAMEFHGKRQSYMIPLETVAGLSEVDLTTAILSPFLNDLIRDGFKPLVQGKIEAIQVAAKSLVKPSIMSKG